MVKKERRVSLGVILLIIGILASAIIGGVFIISTSGNGGESGNGNSRNTAPATLDVLVWNDSNTRTVKFSVFVDENVVWENDLTRKLNVTPSGLESFQISLEKGTYTISATIQNGETKTERQKIEIPDENYWISVSYTQENRIHFHESDDNPILVS